MGYITGHNRDRDSYQLIAALAEDNQLDRFVTDYYEGVGPSLPSLSHRQHPLISPRLVSQSYRAFFAQLPYEFKRRIDKSTDFPSYRVEKALGKSIAAQARRNPQSDLLIYSGSALWAFQGPSQGRRVLFQYHPSPHFIARTLEGIDELASWRPWQQEAEVLDPALQDLHAQEVALADLVLCASSLTKAGLLEQGLAEEQIKVIPYGCPPITQNPQGPADPICRFLFVGQGVTRKGLHLLIEAWRQAGLKGSSLTVVASRLDPEIKDFAAGLDNFELKGRVSQEELTKLMEEADTFLLPSLLEGFGLVLSEALAAGCRLIASDHTGLVDMNLGPELSQVIPAGRLQPLIDALKQAEESYDPQRPYRQQALEEAKALSWENFRSQVRQALQTS